MYEIRRLTDMEAAFDFYHTNTARADGIDFLHIAKGGDFDTDALCRFQNRGSFGNAYRNIVDF